MENQRLAVHRTIVVVDIEGFGDPSRTNRHQVAIRDGLYRAMREAFGHAKIPWDSCDREDRGDGVFILVPADVPKSLFVESLPSALVAALQSYNGTHAGQERIRLRVALHAGEVNYDEHGVTAASVNLAFRLLEASELKKALAGSAGVLAMIVSSWFFKEVVRHSADIVAAYWPVRVTVKETTETGWICLPDLSRPLQEAKLENLPQVGVLPVAVPLGRLPVAVRGRDELLAELRRARARWPRRRTRTWVLAGMGGVGKSTVALAVAARARGWEVWWVTATDAGSLTGGMLEVLRRLGAPESVTGPVQEGAPTAADRAWAFINGARPPGRWLLVFDDADDPAVFAAHGEASPADYTGWLRPDPAGMVLVTTRTRDPRVWGPGVIVRELRPLGDEAAAMVLTDLAPEAGGTARNLARRLGGLPLALHLAGSYLASPFARWDSFTGYQQALDGTELLAALADLDDPRARARTAVQQTWDLSLEALAAKGRPQTRQLLFLLSCYAPVTPIPTTLLQPGLLGGLLAAVEQPPAGQNPGELEERLVRDGLHGLVTVGLIDVASMGRQPSGLTVSVHPVVVDANRSRLLTSERPRLALVGDTAVRLLQAATVNLDYRRAADWPNWRQLAPHLTALLDWLAAHLDDYNLTTLLNISARTARALSRTGQYAAAERLARISLTAAARLGDDHPANLNSRQIFAATIADQGHQGDAEQIYRQVLARQQQVLGEQHPDTLATRRRLASAIGIQGRHAEAEQMYRKLLPDQKLILGDEHPDTITSRGFLAWMISLQGRNSEAEQLFKKVLGDRQRVLGDDHPNTLVTRHYLAETIALQNRPSQAERLYRELLCDLQRILGNDHPDTLATRSSLAWVIELQGRYGEAKQIYREVLGERRLILGDDHPDTLKTSNDLARLTIPRDHSAN